MGDGHGTDFSNDLCVSVQVSERLLAEEKYLSHWSHTGENEIAWLGLSHATHVVSCQLLS